MFPCLCAQGSSIAEYSLVAVKRGHLRACVPVRLARVHTPKLHLRGGGGMPHAPPPPHLPAACPRGQGEGVMKPQPAAQPSTRPARPHPVTRSATCEREEGGEGAGMITTFFHAPASTTTSSHPPRNGHTNDFVGGCFILCWRLCPEQGTGEGGGGAGRLQASAPSRLCTQREGGGRSGEKGRGGGAGRLRSAAYRRDYPSIGCLECITTTSTGIGWTGGRGREAARCDRDTTIETTNTSSSNPATH